MIIKVDISKPTGNIHLRFPDFNFYMTPEEVMSIIEYKKSHNYIFDLKHMIVTDDSLFVFENPWNRSHNSEEFDVRCTAIRMNTRRFFKKIRHVCAFAPAKTYDFDTNAFKIPPHEFIPFGWTYIVNNPLFMAKGTLCNARREFEITNKEYLEKLRWLISDVLYRGNNVYTDGRIDFYFSNGKNNGGIIFHKGHGYSIHT